MIIHWCWKRNRICCFIKWGHNMIGVYLRLIIFDCLEYGCRLLLAEDWYLEILLIILAISINYFFRILMCINSIFILRLLAFVILVCQLDLFRVFLNITLSFSWCRFLNHSWIWKVLKVHYLILKVSLSFKNYYFWNHEDTKTHQLVFSFYHTK